MNVRRTITLLTMPLFLALAIVNGALLYFQEKAEMSQAMSEQALAAAVTTAEFISSMDRPLDRLAEPLRKKTLAAAAKQITGLEGLYLAGPGASAQALVPAARPWSLEGLERPETARAFPIGTDPSGHRYVMALAPAADGAFVAARIDAEPMFARMATIRNTVLAILIIAGLTATALAWFVARRIVRELEKNRQAIAAIGAGEGLARESELSIREARDLADAVRLMDASRHAAAEHSRRVATRRDRERTADTALTASHRALFKPRVCTIGGTQVALRICGDPPLGSFFALAESSDRAIVVLGRCRAASPRDALARAVDARRFLEIRLFAMGSEECLALARSAYEIEDIRSAEWSATGSAADEAQVLTLADAETARRVASYAEHNRDAAPEALLDGIELLLAPDGVFAAAGRA